MKGNAKRNGEERTRNRRPKVHADGSPRSDGATRAETKQEARHRRSVTNFEQTIASPEFKKRAEMGHCREYHRPGSMQ